MEKTRGGMVGGSKDFSRIVLSEAEEVREVKRDSDGGIGAIRAVFASSTTSRQLLWNDQFDIERQVVTFNVACLLRECFCPRPPFRAEVNPPNQGDDQTNPEYSRDDIDDQVRHCVRVRESRREPE